LAFCLRLVGGICTFSYAVLGSWGIAVWVVLLFAGCCGVWLWLVGVPGVWCEARWGVLGCGS
jgi:hypothetical protein